MAVKLVKFLLFLSLLCLKWEMQFALFFCHSWSWWKSHIWVFLFYCEIPSLANGWSCRLGDQKISTIQPFYFFFIIWLAIWSTSLLPLSRWDVSTSFQHLNDISDETTTLSRRGWPFLLQQSLHFFRGVSRNEMAQRILHWQGWSSYDTQLRRKTTIPLQTFVDKGGGHHFHDVFQRQMAALRWQDVR